MSLAMVAHSSDKVLQSPEAAAAADAITQLDRQCVELNGQGRYDDATVLKRKLQELRLQEEQRLCQELRSQQEQRLLVLEQEHIKELQGFGALWDRKCSEYDENASELEALLAERQEEEHRDYMAKLQRELQPREPKWSRDLLNLRKIQTTLGKQKKYAEAAASKGQADKLEAKEHKAWREKRESKIASLEETFLQKQRLEMGGLLKRIQLGRDEQRLSRKSELERLQQRYQNFRLQMQTQQKITQQRMEKNPMVEPARSRRGVPKELLATSGYPELTRRRSGGSGNSSSLSKLSTGTCSTPTTPGMPSARLHGA